MDLHYSTPSPSLVSNRSPLRVYSIPLTLVALATALSVASIVLSVSFWERSRSLVDEGSTFEGQGSRSTGSSVVCLPCSAILDSSSTLSEVYFVGQEFGSSEEKGGGHWSGDKDTCCAKGRRQLRLLLKMFLIVRGRQDRRSEQGTLERWRCLVFPSVETSVNGIRCLVDGREVAEVAHLTGAHIASVAAHGSTSGNDGTLGELRWTSPSVLQGRINTDGRLTCRSEGGVYFVYSQVYFVEYEDDTMNSVDQNATSEAFSVNINRFPDQSTKSEVLVGRSEARCSRSTLASASLCEHTVYAGSLVELGAGDSVYVTVSHPSLVNADPKVTYFGLQKVT